MDNKLKLITKTTSGYKADVHYYTDEGLGYFFGFLSGADFNIPMVWFGDGSIFWDECYGDQHLDLTEYNAYVSKRDKLVEAISSNPIEAMQAPTLKGE